MARRKKMAMDSARAGSVTTSAGKQRHEQVSKRRSRRRKKKSNNSAIGGVARIACSAAWHQQQRQNIRRQALGTKILPGLHCCSPRHIFPCAWVTRRDCMARHAVAAASKRRGKSAYRQRKNNEHQQNSVSPWHGVKSAKAVARMANNAWRRVIVYRQQRRGGNGAGVSGMA